MGVDITFTVDHKLSDVSMSAVIHHLKGIDGQFLDVARYFSKWPPHLGPLLEPWRDTGAGDVGQPFYQAPAGFFLRFGRAAVHFHHQCRFWSFTHEIETRTVLRRFARGACKLLGSDRVLYAPDEGIGDKIYDWVTDDLSLSEIETELRRLSPPAGTFEELDARFVRFRPPEVHPAYYIDTFADFSGFA